mmetsp:Transcript_24197/g.43324  ORF Transcript_24197/g.43324 Transcript_24197/m.43324 type:complete len:258 (+) Transcript_24197:590-1363(+)
MSSSRTLSNNVTQVCHHLARILAAHLFVIITAKNIAAISAPMFFSNICNAEKLTTNRDVLIASGKDGEPAKNSKNTILLANMISTGTKGFFATDRAFSSIHQISKELPARRSLVKMKTQLISNTIKSTTGRHGTSNTLKTPFEIRNTGLSICGNHSHGIRRSNKEARTQNHIAITITIRRGSKIRSILAPHDINQLMGVSEIRIGMAVVKGRRRYKILNRACRSTKLFYKDTLGIRTSNGVHSVKDKPKIRTGEEIL